MAKKPPLPPLPEPELIRLKISEIVLWDGNPREHDEEQLRLLGKSIDRYGLVALPIVQKGTNKLVAGYGRLASLRAKRGEDAVIPLLAVSLNDQDAIGYAVADNRLTDLSRWKMPDLKAALVEIDDGAFDMEAAGWTAEALLTLFPVDGDPTPDEKGAGAGSIPEEFSVLVTCPTEDVQVLLLERLTAEGFKCRSLIS